ncbi:Palmitoyltransferase [Theobroma cacao]|nr:Palmitoyltransferase [Theobroma cacao]
MSEIGTDTLTTTTFFPSLEFLGIYSCPSLKGWWRRKKEDEEDDEESTEASTVELLPYFPCLSTLEILECPKLTSLPLFPTLNNKLSLRCTSGRPLQQTARKRTKGKITSVATTSSSTTLPLSNLNVFTGPSDVPSSYLPDVEDSSSLSYEESKKKEQHRSNNREVTVWLKRLKDVVYDVDHLLDDFSTKVLRRKTMKGNEMSKKDCRISKHALIKLWMAQGFIQSPDKGQSLEDVGHDYFMDLLWRSFFQEAETDYFGNIASCKMHDLMYDLAKSVAGIECFVLTNLNVENLDENTRHMSFGFVYYITVFIFIEDWVGLQSSAGSLNAKIFTFLASLCLFSFSVGVLTDPGYAPSSYLPDVEDSSSVSDEEPKKNGVQSKYCDKCAAYKPPRAHHCRVCRRCILRMDHHCLWINNCVGYWNYKAFFTLVLYATIGSIHSTVYNRNKLCVSKGLELQWKNSPQNFLCCLWSNDGCIICNTWDSLRLAYLPNNSQYDNHRGIRATWLAKKSGLSYRHPFDLSVYKNITLVLGPNMLRWLWPASISHLKDGVSFSTSHDS